VLHVPEKARGDRDPAQGVVRVLVLQGRTLKDPKHILTKIGQQQAG
jgi:hypothetical protein